MGRRDRNKAADGMVRIFKRVMQQLRYRYGLKETEVEKFTAEQDIAEQRLQELLEWQKGDGNRVRIIEGGNQGRKEMDQGDSLQK